MISALFSDRRRLFGWMVGSWVLCFGPRRKAQLGQSVQGQYFTSCFESAQQSRHLSRMALARALGWVGSNMGVILCEGIEAMPR